MSDDLHKEQKESPTGHDGKNSTIRSGAGTPGSPYGRPDMLPATPDVVEFEKTVRRAIDERRPDLLNIVGFGEFSLAARWPAGEHEVVVKRVPPFPDRQTAEQYCQAVHDFIEAIESAGVACVATELLLHEREDGSTVAYHCQPLLPPQSLTSNILRDTMPDPAHPVVDALISATIKCVGPGMAFDGQCSNWGWYDGRVWHLDFSTPMLVDPETGEPPYDMECFSQEYPVFFRAIGRRTISQVMMMYLDIDHVLHDMLSLLHREHLEHWCEAFAFVAKEKHGISLSLDKAAKMHRTDAKIYPWIHSLRKAQRFWIQRTGRRYDSLLSDTSSYAI